MKGKIIMNNNTNNNVQMPESLVIMQAQNSLKQLLQVFPLSIPVWRLIIKDLMHDLNDSYMAQLTNDQDEYLNQTILMKQLPKRITKQLKNNWR